MEKKPKIIYKPSESLTKKREEQRGKIHKETTNDEHDYEYSNIQFRQRTYTADRCSEDIPVKGRRLYTGKIGNTKSEDLFSILTYREV